MIEFYLFVDTETTNKSVSSAEILTLGCIKTDKNLNIIESKEFNFKPKAWLSRYDESVNIHGISREVAMNFCEKEKALVDFLQWVKTPHRFFCHANKTIMGKNSSFDYAILDQEFFDLDIYAKNNYRAIFQSFFGTRSLSTHSMASDYYQIGKLDIHKNKGKPKLDLKSLCEYFSIDLEGHHSALADATACLEIARRLRDIDKNYFYKQIDAHLGFWENYE